MHSKSLSVTRAHKRACRPTNTYIAVLATLCLPIIAPNASAQPARATPGARPATADPQPRARKTRGQKEKRKTPATRLTIRARTRMSPRSAQPAAARPSSARKSLATGSAQKTQSTAKRLKLAQWLRLIRRKNPSLAVARARLKKFDGDIFSAKWAWLPKITVKTTVAPTPRYECEVPSEFLPASWTEAEKQEWLDQKTDGVTNRNRYCVTTNKDIDVKEYSIEGLYARFEVNLGLPLSAFWKGPLLVKAAKSAKKAGHHKSDRVLIQMLQKAKKAYWGVKLAREMLYTIRQGQPYLRKAIKRVEQDLEDGEGESSIGDKFRLHILRAQVKEWINDAKQVEAVALAGLRALVGSEKRAAHLDVDKKPLLEADVKLKDMRHYLNLAAHHRPELKMLDAAVKGRSAMVKLRKTEFWPDLIIGSRYRYTHSNSDDPASAYANDRLHGNSFYIGLVLKWDLDFHLKYAKLRKAKMDLMIARRGRTAITHKVRYEIKKAYWKAKTAAKKMASTRKTHRLAKSWVTAVSQKHDMGLARAKEVADALKSYFKTKMDFAQAIYSYHLANAHLKAAVGLHNSL
jgi:outer membrane protein TolC